MYRLVELCDMIEEMETEKKKKLTKQTSGDFPPQPATELKDQKSLNPDGTDIILNNEPIPLDNYEVEASTEKFQVITYHR